MKIKIGTRGSKLALWQAHMVQRELQKVHIDSELVIIKTKGDKIQHLSFDKIEGKGFFTKEIEDALLAHEIDIAVHSMKDLPTEMDTQLVISGVSQRANPQDTLVINPAAHDTSQALQVKAGARVGTSSIRRKVQLQFFQDNITLEDIRGNVPTRLSKLDDGQFDAIMLAAAGLERLAIDLSPYIVVQPQPQEFVPAPAQGVVAYQCRRDDIPTRKAVQQIHHTNVARCTNIERKILKLLDGGCHLPLGAYCYQDKDGNYHCYSCYTPDDKTPLRHYHLSQSTHLGLAEKIVENLKN